MKPPTAIRCLAVTAAAVALVTTGLVAAPLSASADNPGPIGYEAPPTPLAFVAPSADPFGGIPCVNASDATFVSLACRGEVVARYDLPVDLSPSVVSSSRAFNCDAGPTTPATEVITVTNSASVGATTSVANGTNGQTWIANSGNVGGSVGFSLFGLVNIGVEGGYTRTRTNVSGWTHEESEALTTTYSSQESYTLRVPAYSWGFMAFRPHFTQTEVEWTWKDPMRSGALSHATQAVRIPKSEVKNGARVASGDWERHIVPMTPAEIVACETKGRPAYPTFDQPTVPTLDTGHSLDTVPFLYTRARIGFPVQRVSTSISRPTGLPQTAVLATAASHGKTTAVETIGHALVMPGPSEASFWVGESCTSFTARVGYGYDGIWDVPDFTRDTFEVWSAKLVRGGIQPSKRLAATLVPAKPGWADADASTLQASIDVKLPAGDDVLILKTVTGGGPVRVDSQLPRVVVAEPRIQCGSNVDDSIGFQRSVYSDPIQKVRVDLAGTPEEVERTTPVDGTLFAQPTHVEYGWKPSVDAPNDGCPNQPQAARTSASALPQTVVNRSCGMQPLRVAGTTYDSGIGFHSNGSVTWENTLPTCTRIELGVGFDDSVGYGSRAEHTVKLVVDGEEVQSRTLRRDGSSGAQWFSAPLALGPHTITVRATSSGENWEGHVDLLDPVLSCSYQGSRTEAPEVPRYAPTGVGPRPISAMPFVEQQNGWGPVELNASLGEDGRGDGRPMSIGDRVGWSSGLGVAPGTSSPSRVTVSVPASCQYVSSWVGIDDEVAERGSVEFQLFVDGKSDPVASSGVVTGSDGARFIWADVTGAKTLTLVVTDAGDRNEYDHADWAEPTLYC